MVGYYLKGAAESGAMTLCEYLADALLSSMVAIAKSVVICSEFSGPNLGYLVALETSKVTSIVDTNEVELRCY